MNFASLSFRDYVYVPALCSRDAEIAGFKHLPSPYRNRLLPMVTLTRSGHRPSLAVSLSKASRMAPGQPFLLDLDTATAVVPRTADPAKITSAAAYNVALADLTSSANGFQAWCSLTDSLEHAIPVAIIAPPRPDFIAQLATLVASKGKVALRIREETDLQLVAAGLQSLPDLRCVLLIVDLGDVQYRVAQAAARFTAIRAYISSILPSSRFSELTFVCLGTSFPLLTARPGSSSLRIEEADVFDAVGGFSVALYGDYGSIPARKLPGGGQGYPRVVGPTDRIWYQERGATIGVLNDYIDCAKKVMSAGWSATPGLWGSDRIVAAAGGFIAGMGSAAKWITVRVNIHLYRQLDRVSILRSMQP